MSVRRVMYQWIKNSHGFVDVDMGNVFKREKEGNVW